ncbi:conserved hypothetical protein [Hyphomicrobiales bacterium]|nr:conserved hypothetical protein [Hyphomicrobiales bacterium]CAH1700586.1 hypothetical protein BOSEA1005_20285 [Hyphomicrobiales bacterium]CAI0344434.1 conserved hypothetical protein [Hyphomicrobiales bacterium]
MSVVIFPRRHLGQQNPSAFVLRLPVVDMKVEQQVFSGVDALTQAAALAEYERLVAAISAAEESGKRLAALMRPFVVEAAR